MTDQPTEPLDRIDELVAVLAAPSTTDDAAALGGELGLAWLELYERDGDESALRAALACLRRAVAGCADHPDRARWFLGLGLGYAERARRERSLTDYHEALNWLSALYAAPAPAGCAGPGLAAMLGALCWERYWLVRGGHDVDVARALTENDRLLGRIAAMLAAPHDRAEATDARLVAGLALLERYALLNPLPST